MCYSDVAEGVLYAHQDDVLVTLPDSLLDRKVKKIMIIANT